MKQEKYIDTKTAIKNFLSDRQCFCFKRNIINALMEKGYKKTHVTLTLRKMRKEKQIKFGLRRWGL